MIAVCGDSFCVSDLTYGPMWADMLGTQFDLTNYAQIASTNLLIARQVDRAIAAGATFIIVHFTSCTRSEKLHNGTYVPFSYHTASTVTTPFSFQQLQILRDYYTEFYDLDLSIYQNAITIEHTLQKLTRSGIPFLFDQGGFEHPSYGGSGHYFTEFNNRRTAHNLWDHASVRHYRPYYHITDSGIHKSVADYYAREIAK